MWSSCHKVIDPDYLPQLVSSLSPVVSSTYGFPLFLKFAKHTPFLGTLHQQVSFCRTLFLQILLRCLLHLIQFLLKCHLSQRPRRGLTGLLYPSLLIPQHSSLPGAVLYNVCFMSGFPSSLECKLHKGSNFYLFTTLSPVIRRIPSL